MTLHLGDVPAGSTLYIPFASYGADGQSLTMSGFAVTDIECYGNGSTTQRTSDNGIALLDSDGTDFDSLVGIHGFSIDLSDNSHSNFWAIGNFYWIIVSSVTINSQTVSFIAATFRIRPAESQAGYPKVDAQYVEGSDATDQIRDSVVDDATRIDASALNTLSSHDPGETIMGATDAITVTTNNDKTGYGLADNAITAAKIATDAIDADALAADAVTEIQNGLATAANLATVAGYLDTEIAAILEDTGTTIPAQITALNNLSAAQVNAEVLDVLNVDTFAQPGQENPAATTTLSKMLAYLYKAWRNRTTQTSSEYALYADDGTTKDQEAAVSDDGTTLVRGEVGTGA